MRPSSFTQEIADAICERIANGESLRAICRSDEMPAQSTVFRWLAQDTKFQEQYTRAREAQADTLADEILDIVDDGRNDWMERQNHEGETIGWQVNGESIGRSRLRMDARKWMAGKMAPKKYGDVVRQELTGAGGGPIEAVVSSSADLLAKIRGTR